MKKLKYLLSMLLCMLFLFAGCAVPADNAARQKNVSEATTRLVLFELSEFTSL